MMSDRDHQLFAELLDQPDISASDDVLAGAVMHALLPYGLQFLHNNFATSGRRTAYQVDRFLALATTGERLALSAAIRTLGLPEGQLVVYLVLFTCTGPMDSLEDCLHVELFRSEPVPDWRSLGNPLAALREGVIQAGYIEADRWPDVAKTAAARVDQFLQP